ncbi:MAG: glycosyltransferase, partial [Stellaceae bacterium]
AMLYPFVWVDDPRRRTAAAAGGLILVRRKAYFRGGGYPAIRGELIDDCALARQVKCGGSIALALTRDSRSLRSYPRLGDVYDMVARTAYTQLGFSPLLLGATVLGLALVYLAPPFLLLAGGAAAWLGLAAWILMIASYLPMLRFYRLSPLWAPLLPGVAAVYLVATIASAVRHYEGRGGAWKGRVQWQSQR